jgi:hypothetical protein
MAQAGGCRCYWKEREVETIGEMGEEKRRDKSTLCRWRGREDSRMANGRPSPSAAFFRRLLPPPLLDPSTKPKHRHPRSAPSAEPSPPSVDPLPLARRLGPPPEPSSPTPLPPLLRTRLSTLPSLLNRSKKIFPLGDTTSLARAVTRRSTSDLGSNALTVQPNQRGSTLFVLISSSTHSSFVLSTVY